MIDGETVICGLILYLELDDFVWIQSLILKKSRNWTWWLIRLGKSCWIHIWNDCGYLRSLAGPTRSLNPDILVGTNIIENQVKWNIAVILIDSFISDIIGVYFIDDNIGVFIIANNIIVYFIAFNIVDYNYVYFILDFLTFN